MATFPPAECVAMRRAPTPALHRRVFDQCAKTRNNRRNRAVALNRTFNVEIGRGSVLFGYNEERHVPARIAGGDERFLIGVELEMEEGDVRHQCVELAVIDGRAKALARFAPACPDVDEQRAMLGRGLVESRSHHCGDIPFGSGGGVDMGVNHPKLVRRSEREERGGTGGGRRCRRVARRRRRGRAAACEGGPKLEHNAQRCAERRSARQIAGASTKPNHPSDAITRVAAAPFARPSLANGLDCGDDTVESKD